LAKVCQDDQESARGVLRGRSSAGTFLASISVSGDTSQHDCEKKVLAEGWRFVAPVRAR